MDELLIQQINKFKLCDDKTLTFDEDLTRQERSIIHETVKSVGMFSKSFMKTGSTHKYIVISKYDNISENTNNSDTYGNQNNQDNQNNQNNEINNITIDDNFINIFSDLTKIPIPIPLPEYFDYYLDMTDPYYDSKKKLELFKTDCIKLGGLHQLRKKINDVSEEIIQSIKNNPDFQLFRSMKQVTPDIVKGKFYNASNCNNSKYYISIDIKTANFSVMKSYFPSLFMNYNDWDSFISNFTDSQFIIKSKLLREIIFGKLGVASQINKLCPIFIEKVVKFIEKYHEFNMFSISNAVCITADEVIFSVSSDFDITLINRLIEIINTEFPNLFHVKPFKLIKLGSKQYFVKKYIDSNGGICRDEFKCCPDKFIMQCIKYHQNKHITDVDLKFIDEGYVATYMKSIFD